MKHLEREITALKKRVLSTGAIVEEMLRDAVAAVDERDAARARRVIDRDAAVDAAEIEIEEECLKTLALHQPVALNLRFVAAVLKINNDLERTADQAVNVAERAIRLADRAVPSVRSGFHDMAERCMEMLRKALDALVEMDKEKALEVCRSDAHVDALYRRLCENIERRLMAEPAEIPAGLDMIAVLKNLERVADLATNIAEDVVYCVDGQIIRHPSLQRRVHG
ncbi:MAG TPA: phosphate signaling complex protein PhoU [Planctomycetota bacterium]|nr:phosphate signaling complex protein PhoU [Planctomycetota bacterium]